VIQEQKGTILGSGKCNFPLRSLSLNISLTSSRSDQEKALKFILAHGPALENLEYKDDYIEGDGDLVPFGASGNLSAASFPQLKSFCGDLSSFKGMIEARMECLRSLDTLGLGFQGVEDPYLTLETLTGALGRCKAVGETKSTRVMGSLKELDLDISDLPDHVDFNNCTREILHGCSQAFGRTVEVLRANTIAELETEELAEEFVKYPKLTVLHLREKPLSRMGTMEEFALAIAAKCPKLEEVVVTDLADTNVGAKEFVLQILRDGGGKVPRVVRNMI